MLRAMAYPHISRKVQKPIYIMKITTWILKANSLIGHNSKNKILSFEVRPDSYVKPNRDNTQLALHYRYATFSLI